MSSTSTSSGTSTSSASRDMAGGTAATAETEATGTGTGLTPRGGPGQTSTTNNAADSAGRPPVRAAGQVIRRRERDAVLASLRAGVVPRLGFQHLQVGRAAEVAALTDDLLRVADGGSAVRFLIGDYGAGKSFLLSVVGAAARQQKLVTVTADLNPDRRLQSSTGQARSLYRELMRNLATRAQPDGGALEAVVERFITTARDQATSTDTEVGDVIAQRLRRLSEMTGGYDFAHVIGQYWHGYDTGNDTLKADGVRWLRAEFSTKNEARTALGVRTIIDDSSFYDSLKLLAVFVRLAGFNGLLVTIDEGVNLYKLAHTGSRNANYEQILRIVNDCLQGTAKGLGVCFGGTPQFLTDTRRGLYSYDALRSRLSENSYATGGLIDHSGPVMRLTNLTPEEMHVLLGKLRHLHAAGDPAAYLLPDQALVAFMQRCADRIGDAYFRTPRTTIREFLNLLAVLDHNPGSDWRALLQHVDPEMDNDTNGQTDYRSGGEDLAGPDHQRRAGQDRDPEDERTAAQRSLSGGGKGGSVSDLDRAAAAPSPDAVDDDLAAFRL